MVEYAAGLTGSNAEISAGTLDIRGSIPDWLSGSLIRNGPGAFVVGDQPLRHWFDGPAMLHKFSFHGGRVSYASKFLETDALRQSQTDGRLAYSEFATDPCRSLFKRFMTLFSRYPTDSAKVSVAHFADRFLALAETPLQIQFDAETLRSAGVFIHEDAPAGQMTTAHPHFVDESMYNVVIRFNRVSQYRLYRTPASFQPQQVGSVATSRPTYLHSFGLSPRYAIITEYPFTVNPLNLLLWMRPFIENYRWNRRKPTTFYVMDRHTGQLAGRYESDPFFAFHHVNAFERDGELVVDLVGYDDATIITDFYLRRLTDPAARLAHGHLRRYRLRPGRHRAEYESLSDETLEMPRFDDQRQSMNASYRYVYGIGVNREQPAGFYNQIVKVDAQSGTSRLWFEAGCYPGEPVFVPSPHSRAEDDGVILSVVIDARAQQAFLLCLDAATFTEIGRALLPQTPLFGFHSAFFQQ